MKQCLFACDIDNTLVYSQKHPHDGWPCVEWIHKKEQAYMSPQTYEGLREILDQALFVPVSSRSEEQYRRIHWPEHRVPNLAVTTHGAKLFVHGVEDEGWHRETQPMVAPWLDEMQQLEARFSSDPAFIRCRLVDHAYLFVYCAKDTDPYAVEEMFHGMTQLSIQVSGKKIYLLPPGLHKGTAILRLRQRFPQYRIVAAGDSEMDLDLLNAADASLFPQKIALQVSSPGQCCPENELFSDFVVTQFLHMIRH